MRIFMPQLLSAMLLIIGFVHARKPNIKPVTNFELDRYLGKWYEIVRLPHKFEKDLVNVTATYQLREDGKVSVLNEGYLHSKDGKHKIAKGKAKFVGAQNVAHLKVTFFWLFYGDYIVFELDTIGYQYAMIGSSSYDYLWILSRTPKLDDEILNALIDRASSLGYDKGKFIFVGQEW